MKVLQTLGRHRGAQEGVFQYRRQGDGVYIDGAIGQAHLNPSQILLTHTEWNDILAAIGRAAQGSFRVTGEAPFAVPPNQSIYELLSDAVQNPSKGWKWNDSWKAYVCAILEHEGTVDLYHGPLGQNHHAIICLSRDI
jgi:hypothetical protein